VIGDAQHGRGIQRLGQLEPGQQLGHLNRRRKFVSLHRSPCRVTWTCHPLSYRRVFAGCQNCGERMEIDPHAEGPRGSSAECSSGNSAGHAGREHWPRRSAAMCAPLGWELVAKRGAGGRKLVIRLGACPPMRNRVAGCASCVVAAGRPGVSGGRAEYLAYLPDELVGPPGWQPPAGGLMTRDEGGHDGPG
jgi:hypothetical protein